MKTRTIIPSAAQQGLAADGRNTLELTRGPMPPLKPKPLAIVVLEIAATTLNGNAFL
ncbi:MAG: hypothetical protein LVT47_03885 [Cyanobacteria bacterium LVE1205-1]